MIIRVCVGSSCHLKGSYDVIEELKRVIKKFDVEDLVDLQASFCLGHCASGVTVKADDRFLEHIDKNNVEEVFVKEIYPVLGL